MELTYAQLDQIVSIIISLCAMQFIKRIDFKAEQALLILRSFFVAAFSTNLMLLFFIKKKIAQKNDQRTFKLAKETSASFFKQEEPDDEEPVDISYAEYDTKQTQKLIQSCVIQGLILLVSHFKFKLNQPLFIPIFSPIKAIILNPLYIEYIRGIEMKRPFENNYFCGMCQQTTTNQSIAASKKVEDSAPIDKKIKEE